MRTESSSRAHESRARSSNRPWAPCPKPSAEIDKPAPFAPNGPAPKAPTQQEAIDMPFRRRRPIARMATTAVVAGTAAHMGAKSAQRSPAADKSRDQNKSRDQPPPPPAPADDPAAPE